MSDTGSPQELSLLLPDQPLTPNESKEFVRALSRAMLPQVLVRVHERIMSSESTVEETRKFAADLVRITGVEEERKLDPYANLPTINFIFGRNGSISADIVQEVADVPLPGLPAVAPDDEYAGLPTIQVEVEAAPPVAQVDTVEAAVRKRLTLPKEKPDDSSDVPDPSAAPAPEDPAVAPLPERPPFQPRPQEPEDGPPGPATPARQPAEPVIREPLKKAELDIDQHLCDLDNLLGLK